MKPLSILHLSDLHWSPSRHTDLKIVVDALLADVELLKKNEGLEPDIIVFSGDLAQGGDDISWLQGGYENLIQRLIDQTGVSSENVFIAPGNHDISREDVRRIPTIQDGLKTKLIDTDSINWFLDASIVKGNEKDLSLSRMANFYTAHDVYQPHGNHDDFFIRTFTRDIRGCQIGVACLNSSWRCDGEPGDRDYRNLLIGERNVDRALEDLSACDFRIAVHHHPLDWLHPADQQTSDFLIRRSFDLSCCGHVHTSRPQMLRDAAGACVTSQAGSVYDKREWFNGYQFIQVDLPTREFTFCVREYIDKHRRFDVAVRVGTNGKVKLDCPNAERARVADRVELILRGNREGLRTRVAQQLNFIGSEAASTDQLLSQFISPPFTRRLQDTIDTSIEEAERRKIYTLSDLLDESDNLIILGERQVGKSSVGYYAAFEIACKRTSDQKIPVYFSARDYTYNDYGLKRAVRSFYDEIPSSFDIDAALKDGLFTFFVDNIPSEVSKLKLFAAQVLKWEKCRWIAFGTPNVDGVSPDRIFNEYLPKFKKYHLQELPRKSIRSLSTSWCSSELEAKSAFTAVMNQLVRDGLPRTPYMVSLLLWSIQQKKGLVRVNEAILLENILDHLLGKADFRQSLRGVLNPTGKQITLQSLAQFIKNNGGSADENETTVFLAEFFGRKKLSFIANDVLQKLISCGVLHSESGVIRFKYECFQEFFYAKLLGNSPRLLKSVLTDLAFLDVRRELELLSGLRQQNEDIIEAISEVLDRRAPDDFRASYVEGFDKITQSRVPTGTTLAQLGKIRRSRLTDEQVDEMMDEADRRAMSRGERPVSDSLDRADGDVIRAAKEREAENIKSDQTVPAKPVKPSTYMAAIDTLARVIRNSDFTDYDVKGPATRKVIDSWVRIFLLILGEMEAILRNIGAQSGDAMTEEEIVMVKYIVSKHWFNAVGTTVINHISSPSMADTFVALLDEEDLSTGERLLSLFVLEDINDRSWKDRWSGLIKDKSQASFVIDCFVARLLSLTHSKALDEDQVGRVKSLVDDIEARLGWSTSHKSGVLETIRGAANVAALVNG